MCRGNTLDVKLKWMVAEVRIRQAWKPVPSPVPHQTPDNEPEVTAVVAFERVKDIVDEMRRMGIEGAERCLVGWNIGGGTPSLPYPRRRTVPVRLYDAAKATRGV